MCSVRLTAIPATPILREKPRREPIAAFSNHVRNQGCMPQLDLGRKAPPPEATPGALTKLKERDDPRATHFVFESAEMRISSVGDGILRVRLAPDGAFAPRRSWAVAAADGDLPAPDLSIAEREDTIDVSAGPVTARVRRADGAVELWHERGVSFASDLRPPSWRTVTLDETTIMARAGDELPPGPASLRVSASKALSPSEGCFGLGQRTGSLDRRGRRLSNWNIDEPDLGHTRLHDNLYQSHPVLLGLRPELAWGLFLNVTSYSHFDLGASRDGELGVRALGGELDYYVFAGPTPADVVEQLTRLTGRPALPPLWALGFHQSRWGYRSDREMRDIADQFRARDIPLDAIHFDIDYMEGYRDFTWDPERFSNPASLVTALGEIGVRVVTILDPGVRHDVGRGYRPAEEGLLSGHFLERADGSPFSGYCWPDAALFPDFAREKVRSWWAGLHKESHIDVGVAGLWNDMNEPAIFERPFSEGFSDQAPLPLGIAHGGESERAPHAEVHNLYGYLMSRASYEGLREHRPDSRPWILTRSAYTGIQRYAASWMGDNCSWWEHLALSLPQLCGMGLSGSPHVGVDIGGFAENCGPELFSRWMEASVVYPFMRVHSGIGTSHQEPWAFGPETEAIARRMIELRYRLLPYIYSLAHDSSETGAPILRPMVYAYPELEEFYTIDDQVLLGPNLLSAPITAPRQSHRMVTFPPGTWYDVWSGEVVARGEGVSRRVAYAPLGRPALFARGIIPFHEPRQSTAAPASTLELAVYPGAANEPPQAFSVVDDDGESMAYARGEIATTRAEVRRTERELVVTVAARRGSFSPAPRPLILRVTLDEPPSGAELDGQHHDLIWDAETRSASATIPDDGERHELVVRSRGPA